ncbi:hypothetical protein [Paraburkholderia sp. SUR17]|uniref:hypothetical protein n=1 Tax=Paraburkholderia sp. SUR17 TaxID=3034358 RepID=UPI0024085F4D|nr:hypothetical protein [Paraburkholderia sp. SUR17]WEY40083.1 hypothetical protein P2869_06920 [Paraburkholderia sp. SUR17]
MTDIKEFVLKFLEAAKSDGPSLSPRCLLASIARFENPMLAMEERDSANEIYGAFYEEFDFIRAARSPQGQLAPENEVAWTGLFRWFIQALDEWRVDQDPKLEQIVALLVYAQCCGFEEQEWAELPSRIGRNAELFDALMRGHGGFVAGFDLHKAHVVRDWERQAVARLERAEVENEWLTVSELWGQFRHAIFSNAFQVQLIRCLCRFDFERLVAATDRIATFQVAMVAAQALPRRQRLRVGVRTNNPKAWFASVFESFNDKSRTPSLDEEETTLLAEILGHASEDSENWKQWMLAYNRFPLRYPQMQAALGRALAHASVDAMEAYADSFHLSPGGENSRAHVAICLHEFSRLAPPDRKRHMWSCVHRRWANWNFGAHDDQNLFRIVSSDLDYAIVAYCLECLDEQERLRQEHDLLRELASVQDRWHGSITDCWSEHNRLLSRLQPYAHANAVRAEGKGYLAEKQYLPEFVSTGYSKMMFGIGRMG